MKSHMIVLFIAVLLISNAARADGWVELRPGQVGSYLDVVDAFLVSEYGEGYAQDPLSRAHAYVGLEGERAYVLVRHDSVCDASGCPFLIYRIEQGQYGEDRYVLMEEIHAYYRVIGREALVRHNGEALWLWSDPSVSDEHAVLKFALEDELKRCCGYVYQGRNLSLEDVYVGWADVDQDGSDEVLVYVHDGGNCDIWYPNCVFAVLDRSRNRGAPWRTLETENGDWFLTVLIADTELLPCPADRRCRAVYLDDGEHGERRHVYLDDYVMTWIGGEMVGRFLTGPFPAP